MSNILFLTVCRFAEFLACLLQVSGEALYVDDVKLPGDALHGALVVSARPHARILSIDTAPALEVRNLDMHEQICKWNAILSPFPLS